MHTFRIFSISKSATDMAFGLHLQFFKALDTSPWCDLSCGCFFVPLPAAAVLGPPPIPAAIYSPLPAPRRFRGAGLPLLPNATMPAVSQPAPLPLTHRLQELSAGVDAEQLPVSVQTTVTSHPRLAETVGVGNSAQRCSSFLRMAKRNHAV